MEEFYTRYAPYLKGVCSRYIVNKDDAKDVLQNALIRIFTHISDFKYKEPGSLKTWASKIIANEALRFLRKQQELMEQAFDQTDVPEEDDPPIEDIPPEVIQEMIRQLPTGYRTVFNLYVFEDKTHEEIARLLGISVNTSTSQLCRAKNLLAKMIKANNKKNQQRR
ncbi:MAG: sigma-70 family RNA polymerase sigma factor [Prevotella sp.]|nr:sigma-70 family RNA polymerase sigma factor [Prevotella sp.]